MYFFTSLLMLKFRGTRPCRTQQSPRHTFPTTFVYDQLRNYMPSSLQLPLSTLAPMQLAVLISSTRYKSTSISLFPVHPITGTSLKTWPTCISNYFSLLVTSSVPPLCYWTSGTVQHSRLLQHCLPHLLLSTQNGSPQYRARGFSFARISTQTATILLSHAGSTRPRDLTHLFHSTSSTSNPHSPLTPPTPHYPCFHRPFLGPAACVYLNPGLLPPPHLNPPGALAIIGDADPHRGGWGAIQYYYHFRTDSGSIPLLDLKPDAHSLPPHFHEDLLTFEHWPPSETLLTLDDPVPPEPIPILSISCPESQTIASPDHGITFCNGPARTSRAFSHGPTLANADWHRKTSDISGYWQGDHCHTLGVGCLAEAFYLTAHLWPELSIETVTSDQFTLPVTSAFASHTSHAQECVHSWRLPPHSLFHSTITLLPGCGHCSLICFCCLKWYKRAIVNLIFMVCTCSTTSDSNLYTTASSLMKLVNFIAFLSKKLARSRH